MLRRILAVPARTRPNSRPFERGCGLRRGFPGDRRHGRGCELRRCSGRLTGGPGAPNGASRHRALAENLDARLLCARAACAGCHGCVSLVFTSAFYPSSGSSARCYLTRRLTDRPIPPSHHMFAYAQPPLRTSPDIEPTSTRRTREKVVLANACPTLALSECADMSLVARLELSP